MAHIKKIKRKKGNVFKAEVRLRGCRYTSKTFRKLSEAREWTKRTEKLLLKLSGRNETDSLSDDRISMLENEIEQLKKEIYRIQKRSPENSN